MKIGILATNFKYPPRAIATTIRCSIIAAFLRMFWCENYYIWYIHDYFDHRGIARKYLSILLLHCSRIWIANSQDVAQSIIGMEGGLKYKGIMIYCAVETPFHASSAVRKKMRESVIFVGSINAWKGLREIVCGLAECRLKNGWAPELGVIGEIIDRNYWNDIQSIAIRENVKINYLGVRNDVTTIMQSYEVLIHGTLQREPFGLVVAEALNAGCFVVSSARGGLGSYSQNRCLSALLHLKILRI